MNYNLVAYEERERNKKHCQVFKRNGRKVVEVDTRHIYYRHQPYHTLPSFRRRKLENELFMEYTEKGVMLKFIYL